jgi:hypothetical protein
MLAEKADCYTHFRTATHQLWAHPDSSETTNPFKVVQRQSKRNFPVDMDRDRIALFPQVRALGGNEQRVEMLLHMALLGKQLGDGQL